MIYLKKHHNPDYWSINSNVSSIFLVVYARLSFALLSKTKQLFLWWKDSCWFSYLILQKIWQNLHFSSSGATFFDKGTETDFVCMFLNLFVLCFLWRLMFLCALFFYWSSRWHPYRTTPINHTITAPTVQPPLCHYNVLLGLDLFNISGGKNSFLCSIMHINLAHIPLDFGAV